MLKFRLCRICMQLNTRTVKSYQIFETHKLGDLVANLLIDLANIDVSIDDGLPQILCETCITTLVNCCEFQRLIKQSDAKLTEMLRTEKPVPVQTNFEGPFPVVNIARVKVTEKDDDHDYTVQDSVAMEIGNDLPISSEEGPPKPEITLDNSTDELWPSSRLTDEESDENDEWYADELAKAEADKKFEVEIPKLNCCMCVAQFEEEYDLINHSKTVHVTDRMKVKFSKNFIDCVRCELCLQMFTTLDKLLEHQNQYRLAIQCPICGIFIPPRMRSRHKHTDEVEQPKKKPKRNFECDICKKMVPNLQSHKQLVHEERTPKKCSECPKICNSKAILINHMRRHEMSRRGKNFPCDLCGIKFYDNGDAYKRHRRVHTGETPYGCQYCEKRFSDSTDALRHKWQHTGISPYMCCKCNKMFTRKSHVENHEAICNKKLKKK